MLVRCWPPPRPPLLAQADDPAFRERLAAIGAEPMQGNAASFEKFIAEETATLSRLAALC
jgi:hypothetical protein